MCQGLNSHCFPMVGMVINPIVGVYIPIIRIPIKGGMTIPNIGSLDPGTYILNHEGNQPPKKIQTDHTRASRTSKKAQRR